MLEITLKSSQSRFLRRPYSLLLGFLAVAGLSCLDALAQSLGAFIGTGSIVNARMEHTATLLNDSRVLIGGDLWSVHGTYALHKYTMSGSVVTRQPKPHRYWPFR